MNKVIITCVVLLGLLAGIFFFRSDRKTEASKGAPVTSNPSSETNATSAKNSGATSAVSNSGQVHAGFLGSDVMKTMRTVIETRNEAAFQGTFDALTEYIKAHPELADEYIAALRAEQNEHVLRALARAIAASEAVWSDKLSKTAIELAKDSSFQQRQHIMLHMMSSFPEMADDVYQAAVELSQKDPDSQVKTSAVVLLADWMDRFPEKTSVVLEHVESLLNTATDSDVLAFTYQLLALHKEKLSPAFHAVLGDRLKTEADLYNRNLIASALFDAPEETRREALSFVQTAFTAEKDMEKQRNLLAQIVCLAKQGSIPLLEKNSTGDSLLAQDAKEYAALLSTGEPFEPEAIFLKKAIRDGLQNTDDHKDHKH
jgi:hypothetical protein